VDYPYLDISTFSTGRHQVNHMQHNMSSQTFKACIAISSLAISQVFGHYSNSGGEDLKLNEYIINLYYMSIFSKTRTPIFVISI